MNIIHLEMLYGNWEIEPLNIETLKVQHTLGSDYSKGSTKRELPYNNIQSFKFSLNNIKFICKYVISVALSKLFLWV